MIIGHLVLQYPFKCTAGRVFWCTGQITIPGSEEKSPLTEFTLSIASLIIKLQTSWLFRLPKTEARSLSILLISFSTVDRGVVWQEVEKNDPKLQLFVSEDKASVWFHEFPTIPEAGGRDLADEIQVRHCQITPLIWLENSIILMWRHCSADGEQKDKNFILLKK